jgi:hypothetical protein
MESVPVFVFILAVTRKNASQDAQDDSFEFEMTVPIIQLNLRRSAG